MLLSTDSSAGLPMSYAISGPCTLSGNALTATAGSGNCTVHATQAGDEIYLPLDTSNVYALSPALLTVTASSPTVTYGDAVPQVLPSYSGFVNGDTTASLTTQAT